MSEKKKFLILTGDAGMGHRSAANAVEKALLQKFGQDCETKIINPLDHPKTPGFVRETETDYDKIVKYLPDLYKLGYEVSDATLPATLIETGYIVVLYEALREILADTTPDLVITTYPLYQAPLQAVFQLTRVDIPLITVVTDLITVHHVWFNRNTTLTVVPTKVVWEKALESGMTPEQLVITGIPVNPEIAALQEKSKAEVRNSLGLDPSQTTLLVAGSPRITKLKEILSVIDQCLMPFQIAIITGGDDTLYKDLQPVNWQHPTKIYDFIKNMPAMMRAADLIVCKAGGLIVTEALASGLPLLLIHALPGQEIGNAEYVVEHDAGAFCKKPDEILRTLAEWLGGSQTRLKQVGENAARLGNKDAAFQIADMAWTLVNDYEPKQYTPLLQREAERLREILNQFNISGL